MKHVISLLETKLQLLEEAKKTAKNPNDLYFLDGKIEATIFAIIQIKKG